MQLLRRKVDQIDLKLLHLLQQRTKVSGEIGRMKRRHRAVIYVPERERQVLQRLVRLSRGRLLPEVVTAIYREIMSGSRAEQGQPPIGVLASSAAAAVAGSGAVFGTCDRFVMAGSWPELAGAVRRRTRSLALVAARDLVEALKDEASWREFTRHLVVAGELPGAREHAARDSIFIITPQGNGGAKVNRLAILIECKSMPNAIKSLLAGMPKLNLHDEPVTTRRKAGGQIQLALAVLGTPRPVDAATTLRRLAAAAHASALPLSVLGAYLASEDYGG